MKTEGNLVDAIGFCVKFKGSPRGMVVDIHCHRRMFGLHQLRKNLTEGLPQAKRAFDHGSWDDLMFHAKFSRQYMRMPVRRLISAVEVLKRDRNKLDYLLSKAWLIKPVAALAGDRICRLGEMITINGRFAAVAQPADKMGRALPQWQGCKTLIDGEMFLLSDREGSFDGRYFGVTPHAALIARAVPVSGLLSE